MAKKITIPVEVTGGEKSQQELDELKRKLQDLAEAQGGSAKKGEQAGEQTKKAGRSLLEFDDAAKTAATSVLNRVNPALGGMVETIAALTKGAGAMSLSLLGFVGVGFAIEGISALFRRMSERADQASDAIKRARDAQRELQREAVKGQAGLADQLAGAGIFGQAGAAAADAKAIAGRFGVERSLAEFGAVARAIRPELSNDQVRDLLAGYVAGGRQGGFGGNQRENQRVIDRLMRRGTSSDAQAALRGRIRDVGLARLEDQPAGTPSTEGRIDAIVAELARRLPELSEAELEEARALLAEFPSLRAGALDSAELSRFVGQRLYPHGALPPQVRETGIPLRSQLSVLGNEYKFRSRPINEVIDAAAQAAKQAKDAVGPGDGVRINITNHTVNVGTAVQDLESMRRPPSPDYVELRP